MKKQLIQKLDKKRVNDLLTKGRVLMIEGKTLYKYFYQIANPPKKVVSKKHYKNTMFKISKGNFFKVRKLFKVV